MNEIYELSLFSGVACFSLSFRLVGLKVRTVGYVDKDEYCQAVIRARIRDGYLDDAPIWADIRAFDGREYRGLADIVTAGFPCQDISTAGRGRGLAGEHSGLWREARRVVAEARPQNVFLENVPALTSRGLGDVLRDLAEVGYDAVWGCLSASQVSAPHIRERIWVLAYPIGERREVAGAGSTKSAQTGGPLAYPWWQLQAASREWRDLESGIVQALRSDLWATPACDVCRVANGSTTGVDVRSQALGNALVPIVAARFLREVRS